MEDGRQRTERPGIKAMDWPIRMAFHALLIKSVAFLSLRLISRAADRSYAPPQRDG
jgi:hypothetical protein